jgi:HrpA-like RNA helicase
VEPRLSKVLLASFDFHCTEEVLSIVAMLQVRTPTYKTGCVCVCVCVCVKAFIV